MLRASIWATLLVTSVASASAYATEPYRVTVRDLATEPASFQGRKVRVEGVLDLRFEMHAIRHGSLLLSLNLFRPIDDEDTEKNVRKVDGQIDQDWVRVRKWQRDGWQGKWVEVVGVFDREETGHFGMVRNGGLRVIEAVTLKEGR